MCGIFALLNNYNHLTVPFIEEQFQKGKNRGPDNSQYKNVGIEVKELSNSSTLVWNKPEGKSVYGYTILIRETSATHWEKAIFVKDTKAEIPYSKDNYLFSVQSIDELGHASLPVFPMPIK
jgi:hypothetical protein